MFFPIRCIFWLTIVFTAIFSDGEARRTAPIVEMSETLQSVIGRVLGHAETRLAEHCTRQAADCVGVAERLANLTRASALGDTSVVSTVPVPPQRPNGQVRAEHAAADHLPRVEDLRLRTLRPEN
jgi:hypothetical protein